MDGDSPDLPYDTLDRIRAAAIRVMIEYVFKKRVKIKSSTGLDSYKVWLCGENLCGDIPYPSVIGQLEEIVLKARAGEFDSRNYYGYAGSEHRSGELRDKVEGLVYVQNVGRKETYDFGGDN